MNKTEVTLRVSEKSGIKQDDVPFPYPFDIKGETVLRIMRGHMGHRIIGALHRIDQRLAPGMESDRAELVKPLVMG